MQSDRMHVIQLDVTCDDQVEKAMEYVKSTLGDKGKIERFQPMCYIVVSGNFFIDLIFLLLTSESALTDYVYYK